MVTPERAVHCFVGNVAARPKTFLLLGLFHPRRDVVENFQGSLFDYEGGHGGPGPWRPLCCGALQVNYETIIPAGTRGWWF
jgi:hypothetical protein